MRNRRCLLLGYYGMQNFGDDLFVFIANKVLTEKADDIFIPSPKGEIKGIENIKSVVPGFFSSIYTKPNKLGAFVRGGALLLGVLLCRRVVFWGGSVFSKKSFGFRYKIINFLSRLGLIECYGFGVSLGPFDGDSDVYEWYRDFFSGFSFLGVRDRASLNISKEMGIHSCSLVNDIACGVSGLEIVVDKAQEKTVGLSVCSYEAYIKNGESERESAYLEDFKKSFLNNIDKTTLIRLFVLNAHPLVGDLRDSQNLLSYFKENGYNVELVHYQGNIAEILSKLSGCELMISFRLHGAIPSYVLGIPFILYQYHVKCEEFVRDVQAEIWPKWTEMPNLREKTIRKGDPESYVQYFWDGLGKVFSND